MKFQTAEMEEGEVRNHLNLQFNFKQFKLEKGEVRNHKNV